MTTDTAKPSYGAVAAIPEGTRCAWGARLIWPDDLVYNRQDMVGDPADRKALEAWLNGGVLRKALGRASDLARDGELRSSDERVVTLYDDDNGTVVGNPQGSYGYLYVAAWRKEA